MEELIKKIIKELDELKQKKLKIFLSSSLQTHSIPLVHIIHNYDDKIPIYFLDTGYHFPETIQFKEKLKSEYGFNIIELRSNISRINQRDSNGRLLYASDPDYCCYINKVQPLEPILKEYDVWISGVRSNQTSHRAKMAKVEKGKFDTLHYHPILEWTTKLIYEYRKKYDLPEHPLEEKGYFNIGCMPCTKKFDLKDDENSRDGRWSGLNKEECGLHTETV